MHDLDKQQSIAFLRKTFIPIIAYPIELTTVLLQLLLSMLKVLQVLTITTKAVRFTLMPQKRVQ